MTQTLLYHLWLNRRVGFGLDRVSKVVGWVGVCIQLTSAPASPEPAARNVDRQTQRNGGQRSDGGSEQASKHTHHTHPFNGPFSGNTQVSRYQKGKTNLDFTEARDSEWQWHQLGHMQVCTSLQTDNHASTPPLSFLQAGCPSCCPTNSVKALKACRRRNSLRETDFVRLSSSSHRIRYERERCCFNVRSKADTIQLNLQKKQQEHEEELCGDFIEIRFRYLSEEVRLSTL